MCQKLYRVHFIGHGKQGTHGKRCPSPCAKPYHTANVPFRRVSTHRHTVKINHVPGTRFCRQAPCHGLTAVNVCRVPESGTWRTPIFAVCSASGTRRTFFCRQTFFCHQGPRRRLTDVSICRVSRVTHDKCAPLPCAWTLAHGKQWCLSCASDQHTVNTKKNFIFFLQNFFYTLYILFGNLCLNMIFL